MGLIIFTDLDGSLLNHDDYSFAGAKRALAALKKAAILLIITTSKTRPEVEDLQLQLGMVHPFIVENGGGIFFPPSFHGAAGLGAEQIDRYRLVRLGEPYQRVRDFFDTVRDAFQLRGFGDMEATEIMERTGLSLEAARWAKKREFSEPFLFMGPVWEADLKRTANRVGLTVTRGGRFHHLIGSGQDKGRAVRITTRALQQSNREGDVTVGLGDSENDQPMLAAVDLPVLIPHPDGSHEPLSLPNLRRAELPGSAGWGKAVLEILDGFA